MSNPLAIETWTEYGVGMSFLTVRLYARIDVLGVRHLQLDDFFTVMAMIFWTLQTVIIHYLEVLGNNIGFDDETAMLIPESDIPDLTLGSKLAFINWIWYPCFLWSLKGVMLCLYHRLTEGTRQHKLVLLMAGLVAITWVTCFITHMALCQPLAKNWQVKPYPGDNCTIRQPNYLVVAVGNVITDIGIMLTALPLLFGLKVSLPRKIILGVMFSSGIFVMICAILRVYFSFQSIQNLSISLEWATRESFVASVIVSLPGIKPLFRHTRWFGSSGASKGIGKSPYPSSSRGLGGNSKTNTNISSSRHDGHERPYELRSGFGNSRGAERLPSGDSEEHILASSQGKSNAIHVTTEYEIGHQSHH